MPHFREKLEKELLSKEAIGILLNSLSCGTAKQYQPFVNQWIKYCQVSNIDPYTASVTKGIEFLTKLFNSKDLGYSSLNTATSALSLIIEPHNGITFGKHPLVQRFMKGVFRLRPTLPKYTFTFDATVVLQYLKQMDPLDKLSLKDLSLKLAMIICLLSAQRDQVLAALVITAMQLCEEKCTFYIKELMKTSRPGKHTPPVELLSYPYDKSLCPVTLIKHYLWRTFNIRGVFIILFVSYTYPHQPVTTTTLGRWCCTMLKRAGISNNFASHATRSAATSKAHSLGMSLSEIYRTAGWSSSSVFAKYYNKPIKENLGAVLLSTLKQS